MELDCVELGISVELELLSVGDDWVDSVELGVFSVGIAWADNVDSVELKDSVGVSVVNVGDAVKLSAVLEGTSVVEGVSEFES